MNFRYQRLLMPYKAKNSCLVVKIQKAFGKKLSKFVAKKGKRLAKSKFKPHIHPLRRRIALASKPLIVLV